MPAKIYKYDLYGKRQSKLDFLSTSKLSEVNWQQLPDQNEVWRVEGAGKAEYDKGFIVTELFPLNSVGIVTANDSVLISTSKSELIKNVEKYYSTLANPELIESIAYRPFDNRYVYYDTKLVERSREKVMKHFIRGENVGLVFARTQKNPDWNAVFISKFVSETKLGEASTQSAIAPLYCMMILGRKLLI